MSTKIWLPRPDPGRNPYVTVELPFKTKSGTTDGNYYVYAGEIAGVPQVYKLIQASLIINLSALVADRYIKFRHYEFISKNIGHYMSYALSAGVAQASQTGILLFNGCQYRLESATINSNYNVNAAGSGENILYGGKDQDVASFDDFFLSNAQTGDQTWGVATYKYLNWELGITDRA